MPKAIPIEEEIGKRYGRLVVVGFDSFRRRGKVNLRVMKCECDCGSNCFRDMAYLRSSLSSSSCGCAAYETQLADEVGMKYGKLTVVSVDASRKPVMVMCRCECGSNCRKKLKDIKSLNTKSCGCLLAERYKNQPNKTHGECNRSQEYKAWAAMKDRCFNESVISYHRYGGRGITVCDRWKNSYENFISDMGRKPSKSHSLDRINNDGPYSPENCRWATRIEQNRNSSHVHYIDYDGERLSLSEVAERCGISSSVLSSRMAKLGWSLEKAISTPKRVWPKIIIDGVSMSVAKAAKLHGLKENCLRYRISKGGRSIELAVSTPSNRTVKMR